MPSVTSDQVGRMVFGQDSYERFSAFFHKVRQLPHKYKAAMTRRCFNLCYAFFGPNDGGEFEIISNNALLLCAGDIARYYDINGVFPGILVCDDTLLYGRNVGRLLYNFEELIAQHLIKEYGWDMTLDKRRAVHRDIIAALDIYVYAMNRRPKLIDSSYLWKAISEVPMADNELLKLSERISLFLQRIDIANTSNVLSVKKPCKETPNTQDKKWRQVDWSYRGNKHTFFFRNMRAFGLTFKNVVQIYANDFYIGDAAAWVTSHIIYDEISGAEFKRACKIATDALCKYPTIKEMLSTEYVQLKKQKAQLLMLVLSALGLRNFCMDHYSGYNWEQFLEASDIDKIVANFAKSEAFINELKLLLSDTATLEAIEEFMISQSWTRKFPENNIEIDCDMLNTAAENFICEQGMESEIDAFDCWRNVKRFRPNRVPPGEAYVHKYLNNIRSKAQGDDESALAAALMLAHNGLMSPVQEVFEEDGTIRFMLKAGELSTFVMPQRFHSMIPALTLVEDDCWMRDMKPEEAVLAFIEKLEPRPGAGKKETIVLQDLRKNCPDYLHMLYRCGKTIGRWNFGLSIEDEWRQSGDGSFVDYILEDFDIQDYYVDQAKAFLTSK